MKLRKASSSDIEAIMKIVRAVVPIMKASGNDQWDETYPSEQKFLEDIENGELWVGESDELEVIGVAALTKDQNPEYADCGWDLTETAIVPHRMAVNPSYQRTGLATAFIKKAEELASENGFSYVRIDTNKMNVAMQGLLSRLEYIFSGEIQLIKNKPELRFLCFQKPVF